MEKRKPWQKYLIIAVLALTLYNIFPTILYYSKPLKAPIDSRRAEAISDAIVARTNILEDQAISWLWSFTENLGIQAQSITLDSNDPQQVKVIFANTKEADLFRRYLPRAGAMISFIPAQLTLGSGAGNGKEVDVVRQVAVHLDADSIEDYFRFSPKYGDAGTIAPFYRQIIDDRAIELAVALGGTSREAAILSALADNPANNDYDDSVVAIAKEIVDAEYALGKNTPILRRWFASFTQSDRSDAKELPQIFMARAELLKGKIEQEAQGMKKELETEQQEHGLVNSEKEQVVTIKNNQIKVLANAIAIVQQNLSHFNSGKKPLTRSEVRQTLATGESGNSQQPLSLQGHNPFVETLVINWNDDELQFTLYNDVAAIRDHAPLNETQAQLQEQTNQMLIATIARGASLADETIKPTNENFVVNLNTLTNTESILALDIATLAKQQVENLIAMVNVRWQPQQSDLVRSQYPIWDLATYGALSPTEQKLGLLIFSPSDHSDLVGFKPGSLYVVARGLDTIAQQYEGDTTNSAATQFKTDLQQLGALLKEYGFIGYPGNTPGINTAFSNDFIFELDDFYSNLVKATREDFTVKGSKRFAVLSLTDVEQRLQTLNKIDDCIQEDLIKWNEDYHQAQADLNPSNRYLVPPPTESPVWSNIKLSIAKYFRGDDRKILKWGLDLSGGKSVRIGLRAPSGRPVTEPDDLKQAVNELYTRINKMGVSERTIRIENENILLDFPGSQGLSASELVKASAMYFHIVNEKFSPANPSISQAVNSFLQSVWNEAVVTNRKELQSINEIAWKQLGGDSLSDETRPRSETAQLLYNSGLRLANPADATSSHTFDDTFSSIAMLRGDDFSEWYGQTHPLIIVFHNYALEGANLSHVQVGYDPNDGNILSFQVKGSYEKGDGNPRHDFYTWTSQFSKDQIKGTPKEAYNNRGWRMAVILNNQVISMPTLGAALRDGGTISGRFTQREINQLAADLKAGSLSFTPYILSEQNVSPDLGRDERTRGIVASIIALTLVFGAMIAYYRFAGVVASCALLFNILIIWGLLQNLGAALTLPGIAGIVLTIGMAVDANVLVFERFREELAISGRVASALQSAYRKAFSAIIDSNVTTIIAAIILLQFDSGPIKGFAVTLIIGILSSMFTALFMTRYFFMGWMQKHKDTSLNMAQLVGATHFDFLKQRWLAFVLSGTIVVGGGYLFYIQKNTIFGMDFTGGYSLTVDIDSKLPESATYRLAATNALVAGGINSTDIDIRELSRPNQLRIQVGIGSEEPGQPFYRMADERTGNVTYAYQSIPRLNWVVETLEKGGLTFSPHTLGELNKSWTVMSGQFSDTMRNNALIALGCALLSILIYITLRFEFKYAIAAVIALGHDVLITLAIVACFHKLGFAVQINLEIIGALMTIIGYSLNDTIIIFDRIREDLRLHRKWSFPKIINHALNVTLSRTLMTSGTTLIVLFTLVFLGGKAIFGFSLVMTIGVLVGTLSSLFIASPVMLYFHRREMDTLEKKGST